MKLDNKIDGGLGRADLVRGIKKTNSCLWVFAQPSLASANRRKSAGTATGRFHRA